MSNPPEKTRVLLQCAATIVAGFLGGWGLKAVLPGHHSQPSVSPQPAATASRPPSRSGPGSGDLQGPGSRPHDLRTLQADFERRGYLPEEAARSIERMGTDQLREMYLSLSPPAMNRSSAAAGDQVMRASLITLTASELYRRDPDGTMEWAEKTGPAAAGMYDAVLRKGMASDPAWAKPYFDAKREERGEDWAQSRITEAYQGAAERSAEALLQVESMFTGEQEKAGHGGTQFFQPGAFAEGFDFATFLAKTSITPYTLAPAVSYWSASDPEAAFAALKDQAKQKPFAFPAMVAGAADLNGYAEAAKWAATKLDEIPADQRSASAGAMAVIGDAFPAKVQIFMSALSDPDDKVAYASGAFTSAVWADSTSDVRADAGMQALQLLGSEELQAQALTRNAKVLGGNPNISATNKARAKQRLTETMDTLHFSEAGKASVLSALE